MNRAKSEYNFIVLDGVDGVGKTTIAKLLAKAIDGVYYKMPPTIMEEFSIGDGTTLRTHIDLLGNTHVRFLFYLMAAVYASQQIEQILNSNHVVCDRYLPSTLAYHYTMDPKLAEMKVKRLGILLPDIQFLLVINDEKERLRRIQTRSIQTLSDAKLEMDSEFLQKVNDEFSKLEMIPIDTTLKDTTKILMEIMKHIDFVKNQ